jgi:uncharacterized coiled-coil protein SlyX
MSAEQIPQPEKRSFGDRLYLALTSFLRALLRLIIILLVLSVLGVIIWQGVPWINTQYIQPVRENSMRISDLNARLEQDKDGINMRIDDLRDRLSSVDVQRDQDKQTIDVLQTAKDELETLTVEMQAQIENLETQVGTLEGQIGEAEGALAEQEGVIADNLARLDEIDEMLDGIEDALEELNTNVMEVGIDVEENRAASSALAEEFFAAENPLNTVRRELNLLKVMELITRSRLFLSEQNIGLVEQDILLARDILVELGPEVLPYQEEALQTIISRLELALGNLPNRLDLVENDLESAWQLLVDGLPSEPPAEAVGEGEVGEVTMTPEQEATEEGTLTPTPDATPEVTPTPTP